MKSIVCGSSVKVALIVLAAVFGLGSRGTVFAQSRPTETGYQNRSINPYVYVGRVTDEHIAGGTYIGTGTAINKYSVLTCGHNLWEIGKGWNRNVRYEWGRYDTAVTKTSAASRLWVLGGYSTQTQNNTSYAFSRDLGIINFAGMPSNGYTAGRWPNPALLTSYGYTKMSVGYAGTAGFTGVRIMQSRSTTNFKAVYGAYMTNSGYGMAGGMSGGPVMTWANNAWWVMAVNVSGPPGNYTSNAGVRAIDTEAENFIKSYTY